MLIPKRKDEYLLQHIGDGIKRVKETEKKKPIILEVNFSVIDNSDTTEKKN